MCCPVCASYHYESDFDENGLMFALGAAHGTRPWRNPAKTQLVPGIRNDVIGVRVKRSSARYGNDYVAVQRRGLELAYTAPTPQHGAWYRFDIGETRRLVANHYTLRCLLANTALPWDILSGAQAGTKSRAHDGGSVGGYGHGEGKDQGELRQWVLEAGNHPGSGAHEWTLLVEHNSWWGFWPDTSLVGGGSASWPVPVLPAPSGSRDGIRGQLAFRHFRVRQTGDNAHTEPGMRTALFLNGFEIYGDLYEI